MPKRTLNRPRTTFIYLFMLCQKCPVQNFPTYVLTLWNVKATLSLFLFYFIHFLHQRLPPFALFLQSFFISFIFDRSGQSLCLRIFISLRFHSINFFGRKYARMCIWRKWNQQISDILLGYNFQHFISIGEFSTLQMNGTAVDCFFTFRWPAVGGKFFFVFNQKSQIDWLMALLRM